MIKKVISYKLLVISLAVFLIYNLSFVISNHSFAQPVSSTELIRNAKEYDGKTVVYVGEVIGDIMRRGEFAWLNINDGENAIGVWAKTSLINDIIYTGSYKSIGDEVEITGIFHRACPEHGGDLDIHAQTIRKISQGRLIQEKLNISKRNQVIILLGILGLVWILTLFKHK